jgi:hypothetical protein
MWQFERVDLVFCQRQYLCNNYTIFATLALCIYLYYIYFVEGELKVSLRSPKMVKSSHGRELHHELQ